MTKPLLSNSDLVTAPIEEGDAGFILKPNGEFKIFTTHKIDGTDLTPAQLDQGTKLLALAVAVKVPEVMDMLIAMSRDPNIVGTGIDLGTLQ